MKNKAANKRFSKKSLSKNSKIKENIKSHDFISSIIDYQKNFGQVSHENLIDLNQNYNKIYEIMNLSDDSNQICILYGFPGFGRKSSIDYCIEKMIKEKKTTKKIYIDAALYKTEFTFISYLYKKMYIDNKTKNIFDDNQLVFENLFQNYKKTNEKLIIVIDNVDELANLKRQNILYSFLECLRNEKYGIFIVFISTNIGFSELLERRVKSRLSQT